MRWINQLGKEEKMSCRGSFCFVLFCLLCRYLALAWIRVLIGKKCVNTEDAVNAALPFATTRAL